MEPNAFMACVKAALFKTSLNDEGKKMIKNTLDVIRFTIKSAADQIGAPIDLVTMVISAELMSDTQLVAKSNEEGGE